MIGDNIIQSIGGRYHWVLKMSATMLILGLSVFFYNLQSCNIIGLIRVICS